MALICLALFMALALESNRAADGPQLQLDVPTEQAAEQPPPSAPAASSGAPVTRRGIVFLILAVSLILAAAVAGLMAYHYAKARLREHQGYIYEHDTETVEQDLR